MSVSGPNEKPPGKVVKPFRVFWVYLSTLAGIVLVAVAALLVWMVDKSPEARESDLRAFAYIVPVLLAG